MQRPREPSRRRCCGSGAGWGCPPREPESTGIPGNRAPAPCCSSGCGKLRSARFANARSRHHKRHSAGEQPCRQSFLSAQLRSLTGAETPRKDGERDTGESPAPSPPLCGARGRPGGDGAAIVLGQETGASPRRDRGARGGGGAAPPPPPRAEPNRPLRSNEQVIDREQRPITAGGRALAPALSGHSRARGGGRSGAPPPSPPRDTSVTLRTAKVAPPPAAAPANQSAPAGAGRDIQINPTEKLLLETSRGGGGARRDGPAREPIRAGRRGAAGPWRRPRPISAPDGRGQQRYANERCL